MYIIIGSLDTLKRWNPDHNEPTPSSGITLWPGNLSYRGWPDLKYQKIITTNTLRRGLANRLDTTVAERSQILTQKGPNIFGRT
ncbi:hypothetical protein EYZ11_010699 [Aspergillus tanneri]|uniref:Uncharacterized protein n=1 Tax=Aspergillus tanneri TaxID=1220188 RepID=A0A4S3J6U9_9EURO|nr:hypothetical protein EYZ11_010699 [Aspergillus tanneri]